MNIKVTLGCPNGHSWDAADGATIAEDRIDVSINLTHLKPCPGCGKPGIVVRVRADRALA